MFMNIRYAAVDNGQQLSGLSCGRLETKPQEMESQKA
jgi:hypothetical protein